MREECTGNTTVHASQAAAVHGSHGIRTTASKLTRQTGFPALAPPAYRAGPDPEHRSPALRQRSDPA